MNAATSGTLGQPRKSIFEGASRIEILNYLEDAKERGVENIEPGTTEESGLLLLAEEDEEESQEEPDPSQVGQRDLAGFLFLVVLFSKLSNYFDTWLIGNLKNFFCGVLTTLQQRSCRYLHIFQTVGVSFCFPCTFSALHSAD